MIDVLVNHELSPPMATTVVLVTLTDVVYAYAIAGGKCYQTNWYDKNDIAEKELIEEVVSLMPHGWERYAPEGTE